MDYRRNRNSGTHRPFESRVRYGRFDDVRDRDAQCSFVARFVTDSMAPSHVLVPLDGSPLADDALEHALETFDCRVTVLNVVTPVDGAMSEGGVLEPGPERRETARERADRLVERARARAEGRDRTVETAVETGDPAETILDYVADNDVDHVVMGGHGGERSDVGRRLLGTVATTVVGEAPVTVTVVR
jgi:nucleotide-binding universal stress UspA family protein